MKNGTHTTKLGIAAAGVALASMALVGGAYAHYTSAGDVADTARVAKWAINGPGETETSDLNLFSPTYTNVTNKLADTDPLFPTVTVGEGEEAEEQDQMKNLIAPGTTGQSAIKITSSNTEVGYKINVKDATFTNVAGNVDTTTGLPNKLNFCIGIVPSGDVPSYATMAAASGEGGTYIKTTGAGLAAALEALTKDKALTDNDQMLAISWEWPFAITNEDGVDTAAESDTTLGAADTLADVKLTVKWQAEQID